MSASPVVDPCSSIDEPVDRRACAKPWASSERPSRWRGLARLRADQGAVAPAHPPHQSPLARKPGGPGGCRGLSVRSPGARLGRHGSFDERGTLELGSRWRRRLDGESWARPTIKGPTEAMTVGRALRITHAMLPTTLGCKRDGRCAGPTATWPVPTYRHNHRRCEPPGSPRRSPIFQASWSRTGARLPHSHSYIQGAGWRSREPANYHATKLTALLGNEPLRGPLHDQSAQSRHRSCHNGDERPSGAGLVPGP
jgi:hypothetical protein